MGVGGGGGGVLGVGVLVGGGGGAGGVDELARVNNEGILLAHLEHCMGKKKSANSKSYYHSDHNNSAHSQCGHCTVVVFAVC